MNVGKMAENWGGSSAYIVHVYGILIAGSIVMDPSGKYLALDIEPRFGIEISALEPLF
jgi:hypothetical protein